MIWTTVQSWKMKWKNIGSFLFDWRDFWYVDYLILQRCWKRGFLFIFPLNVDFNQVCLMWHVLTNICLLQRICGNYFLTLPKGCHLVLSYPTFLIKWNLCWQQFFIFFRSICVNANSNFNKIHLTFRRKWHCFQFCLISSSIYIYTNKI